MNQPNVSIIIPAYNEADIIGNIISEIRSLYPDFEVIVIDDGSTDDTVAEAKKAGAIVYSHPYNIGNGAAIKSGIRVARGEFMVFMDGDGQHNPQDIAKLLKCLPEFDLVVGARTISEQASVSRAFGNKLFICRQVFNQRSYVRLQGGQINCCS
jgi:glycosyltransferase involved in cell wall biosynthesis